MAQVPVWRNQVAVRILYEHGDCEQILKKAVSEKLLFTLSNVSAVEANGIQLNLDVSGTVTGKVSAIADVKYSRYALLLAQTDTTQNLVVVDLNDSQINIVEGVATHGGSIADLYLVKVKPLIILDQNAVAKLQVFSIAALASQQLGVSERQLKRTVEYVNERVQFDRAIGTFQAVQMSLADCQIAVEALRSCLWQLNYKIDAQQPATPEAFATAYHACETGHLVSHKAQHVHGGFGVDISYPIYRFLYWSRDIRASLGGSQGILAELGDWLSNNDTLGWKYDLE